MLIVYPASTFLFAVIVQGDSEAMDISEPVYVVVPQLVLETS